jgi:hypothetical protein
MKHPLLIAIALLSAALSLPASAAINAWLDRNQIGPGDSVQLTLQHDGQTDAQPDLTPLKRDFELLGSSSATNVQIVNGKMSAQVQLQLMLSPKHTGTLPIPPLQWGGQSSPALSLTVSANAPAGGSGTGGNAATGNAAHVLLTATPDQPQPYVQSAVTLTVRLYVDQPLYQASLELQPSNDVLVQQVGQDSRSSATRNGRTYQVIERKYLLFPQRSGRLRLDGPVLHAQVADASNSGPFGSDPFFSHFFGQNPLAGMVNATKPILVRSDPIVLNVRPRPTSGTGHSWLPAQKVTLQETWQPDGGTLRVGDPITRHLHLSALGLTASQLPDLSQIMPLPAGIRAYPDQPKLDTGVEGDGVIGTRDQDIALIATRSGRYRIPAMRLYWWDTIRNVQREIDLPERTIDVLPNSTGIAAGTAPDNGGTAAPPSAVGEPAIASGPTPNTAGSDRWPWISLALAVLWLATLAAWWHSARRRPASAPRPVTESVPGPAAGEARKAFRQACRENSPQAARRHLLAWARAAWPQDPPHGLRALAARLDDAALGNLLDQLDRACYAGGAWQGEALLKGLESLPGKPGPAARPAAQLAGLYP